MNIFNKTLLVIVSIIILLGIIFAFVGNPKNIVSSPDALLGLIMIFYIVIAIFLPVILSIILSKKENIGKIGAGKGLIYGSLISIIILTFDYFLRVKPHNDGFAALPNFALGFLDIIYLIVGIIIFFIGKKSQPLEVINTSSI